MENGFKVKNKAEATTSSIMETTMRATGIKTQEKGEEYIAGKPKKSKFYVVLCVTFWKI